MGDTRRRGRLDRHIEFLGHLYFIWAWFNGLIAAGLACFAVSALLLARSTTDSQPGTEIAAGVTAGGLLALAAGAAIWAGVHWWTGHALRRFDRNGRLTALALSIGDSFLLPLGTVLAGYALWALLQEDARRSFMGYVTTMTNAE
jgi:hypothetical protein